MTGPTKSGKERRIPLTIELEAALKRTRHLRGVLVFSRPDGAHLEIWDLHSVLARALRRAGIRHVRWHDLRHSFASRLVMAGADLTTVKELMGHKTLAMTSRYAHLSTAHRVAAVRMLDAPAPSPEAGQTGTKPAPEATNGAGRAPWPRVQLTGVTRDSGMGRAGLEPATRCLKGSCSNHLS